MSAAPENLSILWGDLIVGELVRAGIRHLCVAPGSRSAPLAIAAARASRARLATFHDERAMGYHAVGHARATGVPAAAICTSGTAAANLLPAVVEAAMDGIPLVVLTADRPPELRGTGANQTIPQSHIFGEFVRWRAELPPPDGRIPARALLGAVDHAIHRARALPRGPVHLNCPFREPLAPSPDPIDPSALDEWRAWRAADRSRCAIPLPSIPPAIPEETARALASARRGLLVVGRLHSPADTRAALALARALGWPVVADALSGLRFGDAPPTLLPHFDAMLESPAFAARFRPDAILQLGAQPVSKRYLEWIEAHAPQIFEIVSDTPDPADPAHRATNRHDAPVDLWARALIDALPHTLDPDPAWTPGALADHARVASAIGEILAGQGDTLSGPALARALAALLPPHVGLFLSNSLPVREINRFARAGVGPARVAANRGASGIDGTLASAHGFASGLGAPAVALLGDLALLHDLNSLALLARQPAPHVIAVVANNGGGAIFDHLPIGGFPDLRDPLFVMPHAFRFADAARGFDIPHRHVADLPSLREACAVALASLRPAVIEAALDRPADLELHARLRDAATRALEGDPR